MHMLTHVCVWSCSELVCATISILYKTLEGQAPNEDSRGPNRAQLPNASLSLITRSPSISSLLIRCPLLSCLTDRQMMRSDSQGQPCAQMQPWN